MTQSARIQLEQNVIRAARRWATGPCLSIDEMLEANDALEAAVKALDTHTLAAITGADPAHNGTDTSKASAKLSRPLQGSTRLAIIAQLVNPAPLSTPGYTDEQLERRIGVSHQTVSSARNWLVQAGWVHDSGVRRQSRSNRPAIVWELTPAGRHTLLEGSDG